MQGSHTELRLSQINTEDRFYRITTEEGAGELAKAMEQTGLLHPPVLTAGRGGLYSVVSGFRRIQAARQLEWKEIPVRLLAPDTDPLFVASLAVADNAQHRPLNLIEQFRAVSLLSPFFRNLRELSEFAGNLGFAASPKLIEQLRHIQHLPAKIQAQVGSGAIPLTIALALKDLDQTSAEALSGLFTDIRPTLSHQKEMLRMALEIARREGLFVAALLADPELQNIRTNERYGRQEKIRQIRALFWKRRYPWMQRFQEQFEKCRRALGLPEGVTLEAPEYFEAEGFTIRLRFSSMETFSSRVEALCRLSGDPHLAAILEKQMEDSSVAD